METKNRKKKHEQRQGERSNKQKIIQEKKRRRVRILSDEQSQYNFAPRAMYATTMPTSDAIPEQQNYFHERESYIIKGNFSESRTE